MTQKKSPKNLLDETQKRLEEAKTELAAHEGLLGLAMEDLKRLYGDLLKTQSQLFQSDKLATIGLLSAGIAHEVANRIMAIDGLLRVLSHELEEVAKNPSPDALGPSRDLLRQSIESAESAMQIVRDIKTFSRSDKNVTAPSDLNKIIDSVIGIVWNQMKGRIELRKEFVTLPAVACNGQSLSQVFLNLLVNATHAMEGRPGGVTVRTRFDDAWVYADIEDAGCGIPPEIRDRIFEPFFTTKGADKGTGLGLSISHDIVKKHNGALTVESEVGKGTKFTVSLPR